MADKDESLINEIEDIEEINTGEEGKLVDDNLNNEGSVDTGGPLSSQKSPEKDEEGEETAELDVDNEGDVDDLDDDEDEDDDNEIAYTNIDSSSRASTKEGFFQKMKRKIGIRPKIHDETDDVSTVSIKYIPPPIPPNMPSARDAAKARIFRKEKVRYGKEKMAYYLNAMHNNTLNVDDLIMKSEQNVQYVKGM
jgi:hypothetical protein